MHSHQAKAKENMCLAQLRKGLESLRNQFHTQSKDLTVLPFLLFKRATRSNVPKQHSRDKGALHWKDIRFFTTKQGKGLASISEFF